MVVGTVGGFGALPLAIALLLLLASRAPADSHEAQSQVTPAEKAFGCVNSSLHDFKSSMENKSATTFEAGRQNARVLVRQLYHCYEDMYNNVTNFEVLNSTLLDLGLLAMLPTVNYSGDAKKGTEEELPCVEDLLNKLKDGLGKAHNNYSVAHTSFVRFFGVVLDCAVASPTAAAYDCATGTIAAFRTCVSGCLTEERCGQDCARNKLRGGFAACGHNVSWSLTLAKRLPSSLVAKFQSTDPLLDVTAVPANGVADHCRRHVEGKLRPGLRNLTEDATEAAAQPLFVELFATCGAAVGPTLAPALLSTALAALLAALVSPRAA